MLLLQQLLLLLLLESARRYAGYSSDARGRLRGTFSRPGPACCLTARNLPIPTFIAINILSSRESSFY